MRPTPARWTKNDAARPGDVLLALDWIDPDGDPRAVIVDLGEGSSPRYQAKDLAGPVFAAGGDIAALQFAAEQRFPASTSARREQA